MESNQAADHLINGRFRAINDPSSIELAGNQTLRELESSHLYASAARVCSEGPNRRSKPSSRSMYSAPRMRCVCLPEESNCVAPVLVRLHHTRRPHCRCSRCASPVAIIALLPAFALRPATVLSTLTGCYAAGRRMKGCRSSALVRFDLLRTRHKVTGPSPHFGDAYLGKPGHRRTPALRDCPEAPCQQLPTQVTTSPLDGLLRMTFPAFPLRWIMTQPPAA